MNDGEIAILDLIFNFLRNYWHWLVLILVICSVPAYIAIIYNSAPWGSYTIAIGSALGLVISLYDNRRNLLEEREINKNNLEKERLINKKNMERQLKEQRENLIIQLNYDKTKRLLDKLYNTVNEVCNTSFFYSLTELQSKNLFNHLSVDDYLILKYLIDMVPLLDNQYLPPKIKFLHVEFLNTKLSFPTKEDFIKKDNEIIHLKYVLDLSKEPENRNIETSCFSDVTNFGEYIKFLDELYEKFKDKDFENEFINMKIACDFSELYVFIQKVRSIIKNNSVEDLIIETWEKDLNERFESDLMKDFVNIMKPTIEKIRSTEYDITKDESYNEFDSWINRKKTND